MSQSSSLLNPTLLLRAAQLRATPGRIELIQLLEKESRPQSVYAIQKKLNGSLNQVTVYRALEALKEAGIVYRMTLGHDHSHYELSVGREDHDHAVCTQCGFVEDIPKKSTSRIHENILLKLKSFSQLQTSTTEYFGVCKKCA